MIRIIRIVYKYYKCFSKCVNLNEWRMNKIYFDCYEFDVSVLLIQQPVLLNQFWIDYEWIRVDEFNTVDSLIIKITWVLMSSEKTLHCWPLVWNTNLHLVSHHTTCLTTATHVATERELSFNAEDKFVNKIRKIFSP